MMAWRRLLKVAEPFSPAFAIIMALIAIPLALLYLTPLALGLFAPRLDPAIDLYAVNRPLAFTFLDVNGAEIGHRGAIVGQRLKLEEMPAYLPAAFIAMEDRRFYHHNGIDPLGLARALLLDLRARHWVAGGSTISQQTAKIVYTNQQRTMSRKLTELIDAAGLEKSLSKRQILQLYLNRIYLGSGAYGVDGAARVYFGTSARQLTLAQAAMLATLTRAPIRVLAPPRSAPGAAAGQPRAGFHGGQWRHQRSRGRRGPRPPGRDHRPRQRGFAQLFPGYRRRRGDPACDGERRRARMPTWWCTP